MLVWQLYAMLVRYRKVQREASWVPKDVCYISNPYLIDCGQITKANFIILMRIW